MGMSRLAWRRGGSADTKKAPAGGACRFFRIGRRPAPSSRLGLLELLAVADALGLVEEDHLLGDVGGVVGDALDGLGDEHEFEGARGGLRVLDHEAAELA